jgi:hypothetical protein
MKIKENKAMRELMVDIETMGTNVNAPIIQIGAVYFSIETGETGDEFLININLEDSMEWGAKPDGMTIYWWLSQSKEARDALHHNIEIPFMYEEQGLQEFNQFAARAESVWSHATFDFVMLINAMRRRNIHPTVNYRKARDIRTLTGLAGMTREEIDTTKVEREGTHHNGLDDAIYQVAYCSAAYNKLMKGD